MGRCGLEWSFRRASDAGVLTLDGDLDIATDQILATALGEAVGAVPEVPLLVVDLHGVLFCGVRGLRALVETADSVAARGGRLVLARCPAPVRRLMTLLNVASRPHPLAGPPVDDDAVELVSRRPAAPGPPPALR